MRANAMTTIKVTAAPYRTQTGLFSRCGPMFFVRAMFQNPTAAEGLTCHSHDDDGPTRIVGGAHSPAHFGVETSSAESALSDPLEFHGVRAYPSGSNDEMRRSGLSFFANFRAFVRVEARKGT